MRFTYISKSTLFLYGTIFVVLFLIGAWTLLFLWLVYVASAIALFRKKKVYFLEDQVTTSGTIYAPVNGVVTRVQDGDEKIVSIRCDIFNEYGIFLPFTSEVVDVQFKTDTKFNPLKKVNAEKENGVYIELKDKKERQIKIQFLKYFYTLLPEIVVLPGDRGRRQVNIGFLPFGGLVNIYLPSQTEVVVKSGERIRSSETILARFTDGE